MTGLIQGNGIIGVILMQEIYLRICYNIIMKFRQSLFWDTNPKKISAKKHTRYIIERVLEFGRPNEVGWVFKHYPKKVIKKILRLPRVQVSDKSKALWSLLLK